MAAASAPCSALALLIGLRIARPAPALRPRPTSASESHSVWEIDGTTSTW